MFRKSHFAFALLLALALAGCAKSPFSGSMSKIDSDAVNNGEKSLVVMRASSEWGTPAETRWLHVESGELYTVTSKFSASTQEKAREYDMVTLPPGRYVLTYVLYSQSHGASLPKSPFDINPVYSKISDLGQVHTEKSGSDSPYMTYALRSTGFAKDGKTPLIASFTLSRGQVLDMGIMTIRFNIQGKEELPGYYPAGSVAYKITRDAERARLALAEQDGVLASKIKEGQISRGILAKNL